MVSNVYVNGDGEKPDHAERGWIVQKFGGTSVGKFAAALAEDIVRCVGGHVVTTLLLTVEIYSVQACQRIV